MARYHVTLRDRTVESIWDADEYQQEGPMTTFFRTGDGRSTVDSWSTRLASVRTDEILVIRLADGVQEPVVDSSDASPERVDERPGDLASLTA